MQALPHKPIIGLLGGIGSGKSLVARQLTSLGCGLIDADALARQVLDEPQVRDQLVEWWGAGILDGQGRVDRRQVARIVFDAPAKLHCLEDLVHPRVHAGRAVLRERYQADPAIRAIVEDTPLLMEKGLEGSCDVLVFVASSPEQRLERVRTARGWDQTEMARREKQQVPLDIKAARADHVVQNDRGEAECYAQVRRVLEKILQNTARAADTPPNT